MNPGGVVLMVLGVWVACQLLGGEALERLNVIKETGK